MGNSAEVKNSSDVTIIQRIFSGKLIAIVLLLFGLLALGLWQKDAINHYLGRDKAFSKEDARFKILILPFKQLCDNKRDVGYEINARFQEIVRKDSLSLTSLYLN